MTRSRTIFVSLLSGLAFLASTSVFAVTIVVTSAADSVTECAAFGTGQLCTLRDAILFSNGHPQPPPFSNLIQFNIPGGGVQTITLLSDLPAITTATVIDGYSQPGASPNTLAVGDNAVLLIFITHVSPGHIRLLVITGGIGSVVQGLVLASAPFPSDISLNSCCNKIVGNFIGTDPTGTVPLHGDFFVESSNNRIGGTAPADRNLISPLDLFEIDGDANVVEGNYIGTNAAGNVGLGSLGLLITGSFNVIGGSLLSGRRNVISGNFVGVTLEIGTGNLVSGNLIGTDATGTAAVPNLIGVFILGASGNFVGASPLPTNLYGGNRIAFNDRSGLDATVGRANSFLANSIFSNGRLGIDLNADGVTPNDPGDADTGPNDLQNYPVLTLASSGVFKTEIHGSLNSAPSREYRIQLFFNTSCDPSGFGEGEEFIDEIFVTTDASGNAAFKHSTSPAVPGGSFITATATDPEGNTSEFSVCKKVVGRVPH